MAALCEFCGQEMIVGGRCTGNDLVLYADGVLCETMPYDGNWGDAGCSECGVAVGERHHPGCDVERCPRCDNGSQMIGCGEATGAHPFVLASLSKRQAMYLLWGLEAAGEQLFVNRVDWRLQRDVLVGKVSADPSNPEKSIEDLNAAIVVGQRLLVAALAKVAKGTPAQVRRSMAKNRK